MKNLKVRDILKCTKGQLIIGDEDFECINYVKDTREIRKNDVYIAFKGDSFDGNMFWKEAFANGAKVVIVQNINFEKENLEKYTDKIIIKVEDTLKALQQMASYKRSLYNIPVIAVTGSVGKTSTKDIVASVISQKYKTLKTEGNQNNHIGLPLNILKLQDHEVMVLEIGMNHFGEISNLTKIAKPTLSIITNIGTSHIGNLGSRENILKAKLEILEGMEIPEVIINNDNDLLHQWYEENNDDDKYKIHTFGIEQKSDLMAEKVELKENSSNFIAKEKDKKVEINVPVGGKHFVYNALCATITGRILNIDDERIKNGIQNLELTKQRMDIIKLENGAQIINDSYNASFESMKASLEYLNNTKNSRKIAVLGDMFELGEFEKELHEKVGEEVAKNNIDVLICSGENSKYIVEKAIENGMNPNNVFYYSTKEEIVNKLKQTLKSDDIALIKASNGMKFYEIIKKLK